MAAGTTVSIDSIHIDQQLECPVHSCEGVLLLAAGMKFTESFRDQLRHRGIREVVVSGNDASTLSRTTPRSRTLESALHARIDAFVSQQDSRVTTRGPSVADKLFRHGAADYALRQVALSDSKLQENCAEADSLFQSVTNGEQIEFESADRCAEAGLNLLIADAACTIHSTFRLASQQFLAAHAVKMATLGMAIGIELQFDFESVRTIGTAGMLADLGMAYVPQHILQLDRRLTRSEKLEIQKHCIYTADILQKMDSVPGIVSVVAYQVHEQPDGSGYPRRLTMNSIHPFARILHAADAFAAMTSDRPDRPRMMGYSAMEILIRQSKSKKQDPEVVRAMLRCLGLCPIGSLVLLSDQSLACVVRPNGEQFTRPVVRRLADTEDGAETMIDLASSELTILHAIPNPKSNESKTDRREVQDHSLAS